MKMAMAQPATTWAVRSNRSRVVSRRDVEDMYDELASRWAARAEKLQKFRKTKGKLRMRTLR